MAPKTKSGNSAKILIADAETAFQAVEASVETYTALADSARQHLYLALEALFEFGERQRVVEVGEDNKKEPVLKRFVEQRNERWGKVAQENPYHALVKIAFPKAGDASRSQYSRVLHFAHDVLENGRKLSKWLNDYKGGLEGAYEAAVAHFMEPSKRDLKQSMRNRRLDAVRERLTHNSISAPFEITAPLTVQDGFVVALVRVDGGSQARIVELVEQDQYRIEDTLLRFADSVQAEIAVLMDRPLFPLFRAIDLLDGIVPAGKATGDRHIVIVNGEAGCRFFTASKSYVGPWAEAIVSQPLPHLPANQPHSLLAAPASTFRKHFRADGQWSLLSPVKGSTTYRLSGSDANTDEAEISPLALKGDARLYVGNPPHQRARPFTLRHEAMVSFVEGYRALKEDLLSARPPGKPKEKPKGKTKGGFRQLLSLEWRAGTLIGAPLGVLGVSFDLLSMNEDPKLPTDRYLTIRDFNRLCETVLPYGIDLDGWLVNSADGVSHAALLFQHDFDGDTFRILLPLATSTDSVYAETSKELTFEQ